MHGKPFTFVFPSSDALPAVSEVGGKGYSLMKMAQGRHGQVFPVPPGVCVTVAFFEAWFDRVHTSAQWTDYVAAIGGPRSHERCCALKAMCAEFQLTEDQSSALQVALAHPVIASSSIFAVRSSSPEEDLDGASFAGLYETVLGVHRDELLPALLHCFLSCLDDRVATYKQQHGFDPADSKIAVVIQHLVAADAAGVAFSLDPASNCFDHVVINSNWGLGESVVSGVCSPDSFVVDKVSGKLLSSTVGKKEVMIFSARDGRGTTTVARDDAAAGDKALRLSLTEPQAIALATLVIQVEELYGKPMDTEWAYQDGTLYMLQARPITSYFALPPGLATAPGEPKRLHINVLLCVQGINGELSMMGGSLMRMLVTRLSVDVIGFPLVPLILRGDHGTMLADAGNIYAYAGASMVSKTGAMDMLLSDTLAAVDWSQYPPASLPFLLPRALWRCKYTILQHMRAMWYPAWWNEQVMAEKSRLQAFFDSEEKQEFSMQTQESIPEQCERFIKRFLQAMLTYFMPTVIAITRSQSKILSLFEHAPPEVSARCLALFQDMENNTTVEMGLDMFRLADRLATTDPKFTSSPEALVAAITANELGDEISSSWNYLMKTYGHRCIKELDIASVRNWENPTTFASQLLQMIPLSGTDQSPVAVHKRGVLEREKAFQFLTGYLDNTRRTGDVATLQQYHEILTHIGGWREEHKYWLIKLLSLIKGKVLLLEKELVVSRRLQAGDIMNLQMEDLAQDAASGHSLDLRARAHDNTAYERALRGCHSRPRVFDSRGTILRPPPRAVKEGEISGYGVSVGVARGPVCILRSPDEKVLPKGAVLVTKCTDPSWTPSMVPASAILLETGGLLQHGALVAREYGKPCVVGLEEIMTRLRDGEMVEVDGNNGIVRLLDRGSAHAAH